MIELINMIRGQVISWALSLKCFKGVFANLLNYKMDGCGDSEMSKRGYGSRL